MKQNPPRSAKSRIVKAAVYVVIVLVMIFVSASALQKLNGKTSFVFGRTTVWVLTDSMEDTVPAESYILIRSSDGTDVRVGDVITFYSSDPDLAGQMNTHRVTKVETDEKGRNVFTTRGDNKRITEDDRYTVTEDRVVGIYERNLPVMTFFARIFLTQAGLFIVVGVLLALIVFCYFDELKRLVRFLRGKEPADEQQTRDTEQKPAMSEEEIARLVAMEVERMKAEAAKKQGSAPEKDETPKP